MPFKPAGSDHAIVSNVFTLTLDSPFTDAAIAQVKGRAAPWSEMLPAARESSGLEVALQDGVPQVRRRVGIEHSFLKPDGAATWLLRVGGQEITVECNLYTRWDRVWAQAKLLLSQAMTFAKSQGSLNLTSFSMTVLDRFTTETIAENTKTLFQKSPLIGDKIFDSSTLWHQHIGWLDDDDDGELLQNINIDVLPIDAADRSLGKMVNLSHLQRVTGSAPISLGDDIEANAAKLQGMATRMHSRNKSTLELMLTENVQKAIKLKGERK